MLPKNRRVWREALSVIICPQCEMNQIGNNRRRRRYPKFRAQGFCTSTGVVEAGCKVVVGTRLKRAGMHWTVKDANAITALRQAQRPLRGFLGTPLRSKDGRMTSPHKSDVRPGNWPQQGQLIQSRVF